MESNGGMPGSMLPGMGSGMLGLEVPPHQQHHHHFQQQQQLSFASSLVHDAKTGHHHPQQPQPQPQPKHPYVMPMTTKATAAGKQQMSFSDEEETGSGYVAEDGNGGPSDGRAVKKASPWQRMKWTDDMVRLLIMVVFFVGDDAGGLDSGTGDKKKPGGSGCAMLQKKGKWKSVSKAMLDKGHYVSPQQCEDKFNDLNKRYKRVNDILGKGTACRVVENQSLLEAMDHVPPKMKEEVRRLLNSKHLFFREMCAYHSSCTGGHHSCEADAPAIVQQLQQQHQLPRPQNQPCFSQDMGPIHKEAEDGNEHDDDDGDDEEEEEDEEEDDGGNGYENEAGEGEEKESSAKRLRRSSGSGSFTSPSPMQQQLSSELASVLQDARKTVWERRQWIRNRSLMLEEEKVGFQSQAFELEKQRFKWHKFSRKKERELQRMKLENERMKLENEKMLFVLRQKDAEIDGMIKRLEPSSITG